MDRSVCPLWSLLSRWPGPAGGAGPAPPDVSRMVAPAPCRGKAFETRTGGAHMSEARMKHGSESFFIEGEGLLTTQVGGRTGEEPDPVTASESPAAAAPRA